MLFKKAFVAVVALAMATPAAPSLPGNDNFSGAVMVIAKEKGLRGGVEYLDRSRGTVVVMNGEVVVITAGHSIDSLSSDTLIRVVVIKVGRDQYRASSWDNQLDRGRDIGYLHFDAETQDVLRPLARELAPLPISGDGTLYYVDGSNAVTLACQGVTARKNMVLLARGDKKHPSSSVDLTANCARRMGENGLSGSSLLDSNGKVVAVFFADIESTKMNSAFVKI